MQLLWQSKGKDIRITMMTDTSMTFDTTTDVAVSKLDRNKEEQLQSILYEVRRDRALPKRSKGESLKRGGSET